MNVRIFGVHALECMCAQTRPRFILSPERVLGGNGVSNHVNCKGKSSLPEAKGRLRSVTVHHAGQRAQRTID